MAVTALDENERLRRRDFVREARQRLAEEREGIELKPERPTDPFALDPLQRWIRHNPAAPYRSDEIILADDAVAVLHQVNQQVEDLRLDGNGLRTAAQLAPIGIKRMASNFFEWDAVMNEATSVGQWARLLPRATLAVYDPGTVLPVREIAAILRRSCPWWLTGRCREPVTWLRSRVRT